MYGTPDYCSQKSDAIGTSVRVQDQPLLHCNAVRLSEPTKGTFHQN